MDETILVNYLQGECNDEEAARVEAWCEEGPENRKALEQLYYTLFVGERIAVMNTVDTEASLDQFKSAIREKEKKAKRKSISIRWGRYATVAAAFLTGLVFAGGIAWGLLSNKLSDYEVITAAGQRAQTVLPDGSKVWLNASSKIVYHNSLWSSDRQIDLSGEAYFEVSHDKHAPFIVNSKQIKTCVLGTKFNVRARQDENRVVTTLLQGLVRVDSPRTEENGYLLSYVDGWLVADSDKVPVGASCHVYDRTGRVVLIKNFNEKGVHIGTALPTGFYIVLVRTATHQEVLRFIKE